MLQYLTLCYNILLCVRILKFLKLLKLLKFVKCAEIIRGLLLDGWMCEWIDVAVVLRIAHSNEKANQ